jgi:hypothetical protein
MSFAVPKGLPGNPNSKSLGRMAIETRVHNLWVRYISRRLLVLRKLLTYLTEPPYRISIRKDRFAAYLGHRDIHSLAAQELIQAASITADYGR